MNDWKCAITLATCCCIALTVAPSVSADFVGITAVIKDDPDTAFLCTQGNGNDVPGPLTVCNVFAVFDDPADRLEVLSADLQVFNGTIPDVFFQHQVGGNTAYPDFLLPIFPDLICDSYVTIGNKVNVDGTDNTIPGNDFDPNEFNENGHVIGWWFNAAPNNGHGVAGNDPPNQNLQVLVLQSSVAQGLSMSGMIDKLFWEDPANGDIIAEVNMPVECPATCGSCPTDSDGDGDTDAMDLAVLLGSWGPCGPSESCGCLDTDASGSIDAFDLAVLLGAWGSCL